DYADVDFLLRILFDSRVDRFEARCYFLPGSRLVDGRLVTLSVPRDATSESLPALRVQVPDGVQAFVLGQSYLDRAIGRYCSLSRPSVDPSRMVMDEKVRSQALKVLGATRGDSGCGLALGLFGPPGTGKSLFAELAASVLDRPLLTVDSLKLDAGNGVSDDSLNAIFAEARMWGAILAFDRCEALFSRGFQGNRLAAAAYGLMESHSGPILLMTSEHRKLDPSLERHILYQVDLEPPDAGSRERLWGIHLADGCDGGDCQEQIPDLALTFELTGGQIRNAVSVARGLAASRGDAAPDHEDLLAGAWAQVRADMEEYSRKRKIHLTMDDLILPAAEKKAVEEVLDAARHRSFIMTRWGFGKRLTTGRGLCCLFVGDPGTGKTLCAEILGEALGLNLYQISIPRIMSKYIGETEKNIERVFSTARANNSILLFDEADALFTRRVKVETSVDRFSNMEVNLLMQEIERYDGIVILTTNLEKNMDKAFERRIQFKIRFPFPDKEHRTRIWRALIPAECPLDDGIDWDLVGESFELSGGNIKNAILRAAYKAASDGKAIGTDHVVAAAEAECRACGRLFRGLKNGED
ncbi:MAG: ATP-binding protein, partial [Deltaproteobacteria bacterium]|nr:ATP-binding protein [Deltaproteobacteria bacterium]